MEDTQQPTPTQGGQYMKRIVGVFLIALFIFGAFRFGYAEGSKGFKFEPKSFKIINQKDQPQVVDYSLLWETIEKLKTNHIEKPADDQKILYGAVKGAVE
jgi:hypothetical protein